MDKCSPADAEKISEWDEIREFHVDCHPGVKRYKCRCEVFADAGAFHQLIYDETDYHILAVKIDPHWYINSTTGKPVPLTGCIMQFSTDMPFESIRELMDNSVLDLHIMGRTLELVELEPLLRIRDAEDTPISSSSSGEEAETAIANAY